MQIRGWQILTVLHMTVDALCACCLFLWSGVIPSTSVFIVFVVYNCVAFISQAFTGFWIDTIHRRTSVFVFSIILLLLGASLCLCNVKGRFVVYPYIGATIVGLGNSLFHVYGGKYVADYSHNDMRHLGMFVSTGALGLMLGSGCSSVVLLLSIMLMLVALSWLYVKIANKNVTNNLHDIFSNSYTKSSSAANYGIWLFLFVLLIVAFRSFLGRVDLGASHRVVWYALAATLFAVAGKASGGFIAYRFGVGNTLVVTLILAAACFLLGYYHYVFLLAMLFFINVSMPATLYLANRCCPGHEGFAFGMLAACLIPGYALAMISNGSSFAAHLAYPLVSTIIIETLVLLTLKEHRWSVLMMSVVINILTNVPLNIYAWHAYRSLTVWHILLLESGVILVESFLYFIVTRDIRKSVLYSLLCNATSYIIGLLFLTLMGH